MPEKRWVSPLLVPALLCLAGCATAAFSTAARDTLARSASCPSEQVTVQELGSSRYQASGCGKSETYLCQTAGHAVVSCIPESSIPSAQDAGTPP